MLVIYRKKKLKKYFHGWDQISVSSVGLEAQVSFYFKVPIVMSLDSILAPLHSR